MTTAEYGPIVAHKYYGSRDGVSPDDLWHYTDLGELLIPASFIDEIHAHARAIGVFDDPDNMDDPAGSAIERFLSPTHQSGDEPPWVTEYNAAYTWEELLGGDGWQLRRVDTDGTHHWTRPGKDPREGSSATTGHNGVDKLHVFSTSLAWLPSDDSYSRWAYMVHRDFGGKFREASAAIRAIRGSGAR